MFCVSCEIQSHRPYANTNFEIIMSTSSQDICKLPFSSSLYSERRLGDHENKVSYTVKLINNFTASVFDEID